MMAIPARSWFGFLCSEAPKQRSRAAGLAQPGMGPLETMRMTLVQVLGVFANLTKQNAAPLDSSCKLCIWNLPIIK